MDESNCSVVSSTLPASNMRSSVTLMVIVFIGILKWVDTADAQLRRSRKRF